MPGTADILIVSRRPPHLARLLDRVPELGHEHHWEGEFTGVHGAASDCEIRVKASIAFHGDLLEGAGRLAYPPAGMPGFDDAFTVSGTIGAETVDFQLWFTAVELGREPIVSSGVLGADGREMSGDWSFQCFNSATCGCDGGGGTFRLRRVD